MFLFLQYCPSDKSFFWLIFLPQALAQLIFLIIYIFHSVTLHCYSVTCLNSFNFSFLVFNGITISSRFIEFASGTGIGFTVLSAILFPIYSPDALPVL